PSFSFLLSDPSRTCIHTLSLHDALPISQNRVCRAGRSPIHPERSTVDREEVLHAACPGVPPAPGRSVVGLLSHDPPRAPARTSRDRKSTRLNSSHVSISYAVFCLKKKHT